MEPPPLFNFGPTDTRPPVTIRTRRGMILPPLGCSPQHVDAGEEVTVSAGTLDQLGSADVEILGPAPAALAFEI